jgi:hypothetical protein
MSDLADKIVTHVLYFNDAWDPADGGCLQILRSSQMRDTASNDSAHGRQLRGSRALGTLMARGVARRPVVHALTAQRHGDVLSGRRGQHDVAAAPPGDSTPTSDYLEDN